MSCGTCQLPLWVFFFPGFPGLLVPSWFPWLLCCVAPNPRIPEIWIREHMPATACVSLRVFLLFEFISWLDVLHTVLNSGLVRSLPKVQTSSVQQILFSRGHDPYTHACKARPPLTDVGLLGVSLSLSLNAPDIFGWPGRWGPQGPTRTGGGGLARVPNLRVCKHPLNRRVWHTQEEKDELTSCRGTVQSGVAIPPVSREGGKTGLPARVSGRHVVQGCQSSPVLECAQVTGKAGENGQNSGEMGCSSPWTRPSAPGCGDTRPWRAPARSE